MDDWPIIHYERSGAREVRFTDEHAIIILADGRFIGVPVSWFPPIMRATDEQRMNYISYDSSVYWHDVDDGIDLTAMLTGMYIVPVFQRASQPEPHIPTTRLFLEGGTRQSGDMSGVPFVHDTRNIPRAFRFAEDNFIFDLADGRILGLPSHFSRKLAQSSDSQRKNVHRTGLTMRWQELDENIDLVAMLTGFYVLNTPYPDGAVQPAKAATT